MWRVLANALLALASVAGALLVAEIGVRLLVGPVPLDLRAPWLRNRMRVPEAIRASSPFPGVPYVLEPDARVRHEFVSDPRGYFDEDGTITYRTNALGWRGPAFQPEKPEGSFRIVAIGDSFTFGAGVREEDLFLTHLQAALDQSNPPRYEVINLGVMGFNAAHEAALLEHYAVGLDPDLVLIFFVLNDAEVLLPRALRPQGLAALPREPAVVAPWSLLVDHLRVRWRNRERNRAWVSDMHANFEPEHPGWKRAQQAFALEKALSRKHDFDLVLVIFPLMWELDDYPLAAIHAKVAAAARDLGIPVLDLLDAFRGEDTESLWVHPSNHHPNEKAHAIAGTALSKYLRRRGGAADAAASGR
jgi:lysophospholipase L1-like esterase